MKIRKSKYHQKSVKVVHCGALIWRKFSTNCDAHFAERFLKGRENNHLLKSLFKLSVIFMAFTASGCTLAVPDAGTDGNGDRRLYHLRISGPIGYGRLSERPCRLPYE